MPQVWVLKAKKKKKKKGSITIFLIQYMWKLLHREQPKAANEVDLGWEWALAHSKSGRGCCWGKKPAPLMGASGSHFLTHHLSFRYHC